MQSTVTSGTSAEMSSRCRRFMIASVDTTSGTASLAACATQGTNACVARTCGQQLQLVDVGPGPNSDTLQQRHWAHSCTNQLHGGLRRASLLRLPLGTQSAPRLRPRRLAAAAARPSAAAASPQCSPPAPRRAPPGRATATPARTTRPASALCRTPSMLMHTICIRLRMLPWSEAARDAADGRVGQASSQLQPDCKHGQAW
jgi:hypothetical protein